MRILRRHETRAKTGLSDGTIDLREARGEFPRRVRLGERAVGWLESEIDEWIAARAAERAITPVRPKRRPNAGRDADFDDPIEDLYR